MRLCTDGAEYGDVLFWDTIPLVGCVVPSTSYKRTGNYSYKFTGGSGTTTYKIFTSSSEVYIRVPMYLPGDAYCPMFSLRKDGVQIGAIGRDDVNKKMKIFVGSTLVVTGSTTIELGQYVFVEWHLKIDGTSGVSEVKINGLNEIAFNGNTKPTSDVDVNQLGVFHGGGWSDFHLDDIAINNISNTDGLGDISWCGDGKVELLVPSGNSPDGGWSDTWTGSDSNSVDNYALVDEVPPSSDDYVEDATTGHQDRYALTDFTATTKKILRVWVEARALDTVPEGAQMKLGLRLGGADYKSAAISLSSVYTRILGTMYKQNPATGPADWEDADIDAAQIILETV